MGRRSRAHRRLAAERAKAYALRVLRDYQSMDPKDAERLAPRLAGHLASCSCPRCGNPRRHTGQVTRQELRASLDD